MQIDLSPELISPPPYSGWLEKRGNVRKVWKARYFCLSNGILKVPIILNIIYYFIKLFIFC